MLGASCGRDLPFLWAGLSTVVLSLVGQTMIVVPSAALRDKLLALFGVLKRIFYDGNFKVSLSRSTSHMGYMLEFDLRSFT